MARLLRMPGVSADSDEALLDGWSVEAGASLKAGDVVASVETEKALVDIEVDDDAVVHALLVEAGTMVPVGDPIAVLRDPGEPTAAADELVAQVSGAPSPATPVPTPTETSPRTSDLVSVGAAANGTNGVGARRIFASPLARRIATELDVELATIIGSGPNGRILRDDVRAAAALAGPAEADAQPAATPAPVVSPAGAGAVTPHTKLRRAIATRLQESKRVAPHFYLTRHLRVDSLLALRDEINSQSAQRISVNDFFIKAAGRALVDVPEMNVVWTDDAMLSYPHADVSVAVASERGLVTPTLRGVDSMSLSTLSASVKDAVTRANAGRLQQSELEGGTLTISNLGMFGVDEFAAIINPPQAAILAVGAAGRRPVVAEDDSIVAGTVVTVTLSVDHRAADGAVAARWLDRLAGLVAAPMSILL